MKEIFLISLLCACSLFPTFGKVEEVTSYPEFNRYWNDLPRSEEAKEFYQYAIKTKSDMETGQLDFIKDFQGGTTSVFIKFTHAGKKGDWRPPNGAGKVEGIVFAYNLGRLLKVDKYLVKTGIEMPIKTTSRDIRNFNNYLKKTRFRGKHKNENRTKVLSMLRKGGKIKGVFSLKPKSDDAYDRLRASGMGNGKLNTRHPFAKSLNCSSSLTGNFNIGSLKGTKANIAKQLSTVFLIDALNLQWDRFSGGNIEYIKHPKTGELTFVSHDNGGVSYSYGGLAKKYSRAVIHSWVKRYDAKVATRLFEIHDFLFNGKNLDSFENEEHLMRALGIRKESSLWRKKWRSFKIVLKEMVAVMRKAPSRCFL